LFGIDYPAIFQLLSEEFRYPRVQGQLNLRPQSALVVFLERDKPERLLTPGHGTQHFCCAKHWPRVSQEHQFDAGTLRQRLRQAEQAAGERNNLQFALSAATVPESKHRGS